MGGIISRANSIEHTARNTVYTQLDTGNKLDDSEISKLLSRDIDYGNKSLNEVRYAVQAYKKLDLSNDLIVKHWVTKLDGSSTRLSKVNAEKLLRGDNIFHEKTLRGLNAKLDEFKNKRPTIKFDQDKIDNVVANYEKAVTLYEREFNRLKTR
jgi:hypothetical protein